MSYNVRNDAHMRAANKYLDPFYGLIFYWQFYFGRN